MVKYWVEKKFCGTKLHLSVLKNSGFIVCKNHNFMWHEVRITPTQSWARFHTWLNFVGETLSCGRKTQERLQYHQLDTSPNKEAHVDHNASLYYDYDTIRHSSSLWVQAALGCSIYRLKDAKARKRLSSKRNLCMHCNDELAEQVRCPKVTLHLPLLFHMP